LQTGIEKAGANNSASALIFNSARMPVLFVVVVFEVYFSASVCINGQMYI
jgi:hypothetical protein